MPRFEGDTLRFGTAMVLNSSVWALGSSRWRRGEVKARL
jgi:hypothetical protein